MDDVRLTMDPAAATLGAHIRGLGQKIDKASTLAISTATRQTGSEARRVVRDATGLKAKQIRRRVFATVRTAKGKIWVGLNPWPAGYLSPLTPKTMSPEQQADLPGSYAREFFFKGAFVARMKSGHLGIYRREGKKRTPIQEETVAFEAFGASVAGVRAHLERFAGDVLQREFVRQMERKT